MDVTLFFKPRVEPDVEFRERILEFARGVMHGVLNEVEIMRADGQDLDDIGKRYRLERGRVEGLVHY